MELLFECLEDTDIVRVATVKRTVAPDHNGIYGADVCREGIAFLEVFEDGLLVRNGDTEATDAEFRDGIEKIAKPAHQKREIDSVHLSCDKSRVMQKRRKRMADGIANHSVDASAAREDVRAIEMLHVGERNLPGGGRIGDGCVRQSASFPQREDAGRQAGLTHRNGDKILRLPCQSQETDAVVNAASFGGDLHGVGAAMGRRVHAPRQIRRALEVVNRKQYA